MTDDTITIGTEQTLKEIADETGVNDETLVEYVAEGIEAAYKARKAHEDGDALDTLAKALGTEPLN